MSSSGWAPGSSVGSAGMPRWQQAACLSGPGVGPPERHKYNQITLITRVEKRGSGGGGLENELTRSQLQSYKDIQYNQTIYYRNNLT